MFWDMVFTEVELEALGRNVADKCPVDVRFNASHLDVLKEVLNPDNDDLGTNAACIGCPFKINAPDYLNCSLIAQQVSHQLGGFDPSEVAEMLEITKSAMEKLELRILIKLMRKLIDEPTTSQEVRELRKYIRRRFGVK